MEYPIVAYPSTRTFEKRRAVRQVTIMGIVMVPIMTNRSRWRCFAGMIFSNADPGAAFADDCSVTELFAVAPDV